jgi:hypothetical protein
MYEHTSTKLHGVTTQQYFVTSEITVSVQLEIGKWFCKKAWKFAVLSVELHFKILVFWDVLLCGFVDGTTSRAEAGHEVGGSTFLRKLDDLCLEHL